MSKKILHLSLKKEPFEVMVTGEKIYEIRKPSKWIKSRLFNPDGSKKKYDSIKYVNGYGADKPSFLCGFKGFFVVSNGYTMQFSNGLKIEVERGDIVIMNGKIETVLNC